MEKWCLESSCALSGLRGYLRPFTQASGAALLRPVLIYDALSGLNSFLGTSIQWGRTALKGRKIPAQGVDAKRQALRHDAMESVSPERAADSA